MQFNGFSVDNIGSFQQHFSVDGLLEAIDIQIVFKEWVSNILKSGGLDTATEGIIREAQGCFNIWTGKADSCDLTPTKDLSRWKNERNADLCRRLAQWEDKVGEDKRLSYHALCKMLCLLFEIGEYTVSYEEEELIYRFLIEQELIEQVSLKLCVTGQERVSLFCGEKFVTDVCPVKSEFYKGQGLVSVAENRDTGYLGITDEGELVNGSAFDVPHIGTKVVKTCINQGAYAILLEDGSVVHNLHQSFLPKAPVKNIDLYGEQLVWQLIN